MAKSQLHGQSIDEQKILAFLKMFVLPISPDFVARNFEAFANLLNMLMALSHLATAECILFRIL